MKIEIKIDKEIDILPVGTYLTPTLDIGYLKSNEVVKVWFNNDEEIQELYDRYKYNVQNDWDTEEPPTIEEFLYSDYILILLGCVNGEGHEVLYS
jgi:hypothetical protein